jgi:type II secretory pathway component PulF
MDTWFPTFRRLTGIQTPFPSIWPWRATRAQRRALLRLIVVATERNIPLAPLVEAWAADESGMQKHRLYRLAALLQSGTPLPDALEEVRDVLADEEVMAVRFGAQSGTLAASLGETLAEPDMPTIVLLSRWRKTLVYVCIVFVVAVVIVAFLQIKIVPKLNKIIEEFDIPMPQSLEWSIVFATFSVRYWFLLVLAIAVVFWLVFTSWPGRRLRRAILGRMFRSPREVRIADVLQQLGIAAAAGRPVAGAISTLARYHYDPALRHQLLFVRNEIEQGADVWQSMQSVGLLNPPETRVLISSERIGNRAWALKQLAHHKRRQTTRHLARWTELVLPLVIILMGSFVLFQALGVFGPLVQFIRSLV